MSLKLFIPVLRWKLPIIWGIIFTRKLPVGIMIVTPATQAHMFRELSLGLQFIFQSQNVSSHDTLGKLSDLFK
jgi:hypothetical protein